MERNQIRLFFFIVLNLVCVGEKIYGMLSPDQTLYPHCKPHDPELTALIMRIKNEPLLHIIQDVKGITIKHTFDFADRCGACHDYTMHAIMGIHDIDGIKKLGLPGGEDIWFTVFDILRYFDHVEQPQPGDIVIYTPNNNDHTIYHSGIFIGDGYVESKWGTQPYVLEHPVFYTEYGDTVYYFRLKQHIDLYATIQEERAQQKCKDMIAEYLKGDEMRLLRYVKGQYTFSEFGSAGQDAETILTVNVLARNPAIDINLLCDNDGRTVLMQAIKYKRVKAIEILIAYGADVQVQDKQGNTPLSLAMKYGYTEIADLLRTYGAH